MRSPDLNPNHKDCPVERHDTDHGGDRVSVCDAADSGYMRGKFVMKTLLKTVTLAATLIAAGSALADQQTVTLAVKNMTCASCPYIVKQSLVAVPGVSDVKVSFKNKIAIVTFEDSTTTVAALTAATTNNGFPSEVLK
jgi:mercuric ion binding protein